MLQDMRLYFFINSFPTISGISSHNNTPRLGKSQILFWKPISINKDESEAEFLLQVFISSSKPNSTQRMQFNTKNATQHKECNSTQRMQLNTKNTTQQLVESIDLEYGKRFFAKGFLIGVKGTKWTIMNYHFVLNEDKNKVDLQHFKFYDNRSNETLKPERPKPSRQYQDFDFMDLRSPEDSLDLLKAMEWIGKANKAQDLTFLMAKTKLLPVSLTTSTFGSHYSEYKDGVSEMEEEFGHLAPFLRGEYPGMDD